jgi:hypothetical protein
MDPQRFGGVDRARTIAACGDTAVLLLFAAIGRSSHHAQDHGPVLGVLGTAAPFIAGWFAAAAVLGAFAGDALSSPGLAARRAARAWIPGALLGCAIRSAVEGHLTPISFVAIALGFNLILLTVWRTALAALIGGEQRLDTAS